MSRASGKYQNEVELKASTQQVWLNRSCLKIVTNLLLSNLGEKRRVKDEASAGRLARRIDVIDNLQKFANSAGSLKDLGAEALTYTAGKRVQGQLSSR